jgi:PIN domain nuclease of toxin-antitoxin system
MDTHVYIWAILNADKLSPKARAAMADEQNELCLSIASLWEATIKISKGSMQVPGNHISFLLSHIEAHNIQVLPIAFDHLRALQTLPELHRDPFDRILVAQSISEEIPMITVDQKIQEYEVNCLW